MSVGELREAIGVGSIPLAPSSAWPAMQMVLAKALRPEPAGRPTASELAAAVGAVRTT
ncbi:hypothetical protein [Streptomyces sp. NPDC020917]|uniref:hypothetical protein n=1 Tax=Streptomyces sp. NPDC020917 TaxID=3365102 RepID=UPI0037903A6B